MWLAEIGGETAGVLVVEKDPGFLLIYSIAVDPAFQGKGLGLALLGQAKKIAARMGLSELRLYTNSRMEANIRLYLKPVSEGLASDRIRAGSEKF